MDPSRYLCQTQKVHSKIKLEKYRPTQLPVSPKRKRSELIRANRDQLETKSFQVMQLPQTLSNPLRNSSQSFTDLQIVMANIDAVFNITDQEAGYLVPQYVRDYDVVDVTGTSINYFQYRIATTRFFTEKNGNYLDGRQVNQTGQEKLSEFTKSIVPIGVDLVVDTSSEPFSKKLILALETCRPSGKWLCRLDRLNPSLLYIASQCFQTISLFQPMADNTNLARFYLVAEQFLGTATDWIQIVRLTPEIGLDVPEVFLDYLERFAESYQELISELAESNPQYNIYKCKAIWNIF